MTVPMYVLIGVPGVRFLSRATLDAQGLELFLKTGSLPFSNAIEWQRFQPVSMKKLKPVNAVIVGGGWTGLSMAKEITSRTSLSVVVLERGAPRNADDYLTGMDEVDYALRFRMMQNITEETITHRHSPQDAAVPVRQYGSFLPGAASAERASIGRGWPSVFSRVSSHWLRT